MFSYYSCKIFSPKKLKIMAKRNISPKLPMGNTKKKDQQQNYIDKERTIASKQLIKEHRQRIIAFLRENKHTLMISKFSQHTWEQNVRFRNKNKNVGCLYGTPILVAKDIPLDSVLFVLEMDITNNVIRGIGMVKNHPICGKYSVYNDNMNVNRYLYMGKMRLGREDMTEEENEMMRFFDYVCFNGAKHMKRGNGLSRFPPDILYRCLEKMDLVQYVCDMMKKRICVQNKI